jgi:hypothetical protein
MKRALQGASMRSRRPAGSLAQETALELEAEVGVARDAVAAQMVSAWRRRRAAKAAS